MSFGSGLSRRYSLNAFERLSVMRMIKTVEAIIDEQGNVRPSEAESALLSEAALAEDWNRPEEDEAWLHLQQVR